jgi:hypothetical protein
MKRQAAAATAVLALVMVGRVAPALGGTGGPVTVAQASKCLNEHHVIASEVPPNLDPIPPRFQGIGVVTATWALVHGAELDSARLVFASDHAAAVRLAASFDGWAIAHTHDKASARLYFRRQQRIVNNVVVTWAYPAVKAASRRTLAACLNQ